MFAGAGWTQLSEAARAKRVSSDHHQLLLGIFHVGWSPATGGEKLGRLVTRGEGQQLQHRFSKGNSELLISLTSSDRRKISAHRDLTSRSVCVPLLSLVTQDNSSRVLKPRAR